VLLVPAVSVPHERNVLINPLHSEFGRISVGEAEPLRWDERLFRHDG
jgi:RES domain-containing protein